MIVVCFLSVATAVADPVIGPDRGPGPASLQRLLDSAGGVHRCRRHGVVRLHVGDRDRLVGRGQERRPDGRLQRETVPHDQYEQRGHVHHPQLGLLRVIAGTN